MTTAPVTAGFDPSAGWTHGNAVSLHTTTDAWVDSLVQDMSRARSAISLNFFSWLPNGSGARLAEAAMERARDGIAVSARFDRIGGLTLLPGPRQMHDDLRAAGVDVQVDGRIGGLPFIRADHEKLATIDARIMHTGGRNPGAMFDAWRDLMVRVEGPAAADAAEHFARGAEGGASEQQLAAIADARRAPQLLGDAQVRFLANVAGGPRELTHHVMHQIRTAQDSLWVENPYIGFPDAPAALVAAAEGGAEVVHTGPTPYGTQHRIHFNRLFYPELVDGGVSVLEYPGMTHAKAVLTPELATVSSHNLNLRSARTDAESGVAVRDAQFGADLRRFLAEGQDASRPFGAAVVDSAAWRGAALVRGVVGLRH